MSFKVGEIYEPSNGTEGMIFTDKFCMQCLHCDPDPEGEKQCEILCATMCFSKKDKEYPREWIYDAEGNPTCTKWQKWDWGNDGDPDDPDNPNKPPYEPNDPNQLMMFSVADEVLQNHKVEEVISKIKQQPVEI